MTSVAKFSIQQLLESGVHFGHKTMRWNPKMAPYIYGVRNGIHILDLQQTAPMLHSALKQIHNVVKNNGKVLFVGTKRQASDILAEAAKKCGQYYVNHRWLGGMLTNWGTVSKSIKTLESLEQKLALQEAIDEASDEARLTKKEKLEITRKLEKLEKSLGGIREMGGRPDILFVIDTNKENIAILEANKLGIPVVAILDTNSNPDGIDFSIPGNDDASRAIKLYCDLVSNTVLNGIQDSLADSGVDIGAAEVLPIAANTDEITTKEKKTAKKEKTEVDTKDKTADTQKKAAIKKKTAPAKEAKADAPKKTAKTAAAKKEQASDTKKVVIKTTKKAD
jgi:small subunit ribosomal protein S2